MGEQASSPRCLRRWSDSGYFVRDLRAPFGGFTDSAIGREGGKHSREFFTEAKTVVMEM
jgi:acyl-CoA reductase-like NAD-dependent aldehyde dehydrogenase